MTAGLLAQFLASGPRAPAPAMPGGNTDWARAYSTELKQLIYWHAAHAPRNQQAHLGPSELGVVCHRQVVGKMTAEPATNHVSYLWPAIIGTAVHMWLALALQDENARLGFERFLTEMRVAPVPEHPGATDFYDAYMKTVGDWKILGPGSMTKISAAKGPPHRYRIQLLLYWLGCLIAGYPAERIALIALPRTRASLDGMYVWSHEPGPEDIELITEVLRVTALRRQLAAAILRKELTLADIPITPDDDECIFCPYFRPALARDPDPRSSWIPGSGCPGTSIGAGPEP